MNVQNLEMNAHNFKGKEEIVNRKGKSVFLQLTIKLILTWSRNITLAEQFAHLQREGLR